MLAATTVTTTVTTSSTAPPPPPSPAWIGKLPQIYLAVKVFQRLYVSFFLFEFYCYFFFQLNVSLNIFSPT